MVSVSHKTTSKIESHTVLRRLHEWPSPPKRTKHGCFAWAGFRLHILIVVSSEAEAIMRGFSGEVARSLIS